MAAAMHPRHHPSRNRPGLDRKLGVARPLAHRRVIQGQVRVAELMEKEEVHGGEDPAPVVGDDVSIRGRGRIGTLNVQIRPGAQYLEPRDEGRKSTRLRGGRGG